jgi:hypothetical protein
MTDDLKKEDCAAFDDLSSRLPPALFELAMTWISPNADPLPQLFGIQVAMMRVASRVAGLIHKQYGTDLAMFMRMAQLEFEVVAAKAAAEKAKAALGSSLRSDNTGTRH